MDSGRLDFGPMDVMCNVPVTKNFSNNDNEEEEEEDWTRKSFEEEKLVKLRNTNKQTNKKSHRNTNTWVKVLEE